MKRFSLFLGLLLIGLVSSPASAGCGCGMASCGGGQAVYTPPVAVDWGSRLGLDQDQKHKFDMTLQAHGKGLRSLQQRRNELIAELRTLVSSGSSDKTHVNRLQKQISKVQREMERSRYDIWDRVAGFLTPAQRAGFILENVNEWPMQDLLASIQSAEAW